MTKSEDPTSALHSHLRRKNPDGIPIQDAVQLFVWVYCTLDVLPPQLRKAPLGRKELVGAFGKLTEDGLIICPEKGEPIPTGGWDAVVQDILADRVRPDPAFLARIGSYL